MLIKKLQHLVCTKDFKRFHCYSKNLKPLDFVKLVESTSNLLIFFLVIFRSLINLNPKNNVPSKSSKLKQSQEKTDTTTPENEELHRQNEMLLCQFENDVEKVKEAQKRLYDLSQLITTFSNKIVEQDLTTESSRERRKFKNINFSNSFG